MPSSACWTQDKLIGGGQYNWACHYIDLMRLLRCAYCSVQALGMGRDESVQITEDRATILLGFNDGSFGAIHYLANGGSSFPKEQIRVLPQVMPCNLTISLNLKVSIGQFQKLSFGVKTRDKCLCCSVLKSIETSSPLLPTDELKLRVSL